MESKNLLTLAITLTVGIILAGSLLAPVISDATTTERTFENEGYFYVEKISADDDRTITIEWDRDAFGTMIWNGTNVDVSTWPSGGYTVATDGVSKIIRMGMGNSVALQTLGDSFSSGGGNTKHMEITIANGTITANSILLNDTTYSVTTTYTEVWAYSLTPTDYVMKKADKIAYLNEDSEYLAMGVTTVTQWNTIIKVTGTVSDFDVSIVYPSGVTATTTNKEVVIERNDEYTDLYELDKLTFTVSDGTTTVDAIYSYFIVPAKVTSELTNHLDDGEIAIMNAIPIMIIVALVVMAAGALYLRRTD